MQENKRSTSEEKKAEYEKNILKHEKSSQFYVRLNQLIDAKRNEGLTIENIASGIGNLSDAGLIKWMYARSEPKVSSMIDLAKYFDVSLDYLCGLTDIKKTDADITASAKYTGLSEKALENINKLKNEDTDYCDNVIDILDTLLSYDYYSLHLLLSNIASIKNSKIKLNNRINEWYSRLEEDIYSAPGNVIDSINRLKLSYFESDESFKDLINKIYQVKKSEQDVQKAIEKVALKTITKKKKLSDVDSSQMSIFEEEPQRSE